MNQTWTIELFVYLTTALSALLLLPRCANWRSCLIVGTIGMQALAQSVMELKLNYPFWQSRLGSLAGVLEMFGGALALTAIHLLRKENEERKSIDGRVRLSQAVESIPNLGQQRARPAAPPPVEPGAIVRDASASIAALDASVSERDRSVPPHEQRKARPLPVSLLAKIARLDGPKGVMEGEIEDISQGGARLCLPEFVPPGGLLKVEFRNRMSLGEVRSCEELQGRYVAGVQFEHMVDLTELSRILREIGLETRKTGARMRSAGNQNRSFAGKNSAISFCSTVAAAAERPPGQLWTADRS
jgi:PilZ domain-containing protein